jgi:hypothetical protein
MIKNNFKIVDTASSIPQSLNSISNFRFLICVCSKNDTCSKAYSFKIICGKDEKWNYELFLVHFLIEGGSLEWAKIISHHARILTYSRFSKFAYNFHERIVHCKSRFWNYFLGRMRIENMLKGFITCQQFE